MKKYLTALTTLLLSAVMMTSAFASVTFTDISTHWGKLNISQLADKGVVNGYPDGTFKPQIKVTRGEIATLIYTASELLPNVPKAEQKNDSVFDDTANHWANKYISALVSLNIIDTNEYGTFFNVDKPASRREVAKMVVRALGYMPTGAEVKTKFSDDSSISAFDKFYISKASELGIISGYEDNTFRPGNDITRAEACTIILNMINVANGDGDKANTELAKKANEYMAKTNILNNCKDSVALIQNPKSVADLKTNLNAMTGYNLSTMKARSDYKLVSMEQVITLNGKSLESYHDFGNYKNRVVGAVKLDVYDPNSTITMTRFITKDNEVHAYANDGKELRYPFILREYIGTEDETESGLIKGLVLKDNVVVGKLDYSTSLKDYSVIIELFDEYKNEGFDAIALNLEASNYLDGYSNDINLADHHYVSTVIKLPKIEFVDYQL